MISNGDWSCIVQNMVGFVYILYCLKPKIGVRIPHHWTKPILPVFQLFLIVRRLVHTIYIGLGFALWLGRPHVAKSWDGQWAVSLLFFRCCLVQSMYWWYPQVIKHGNGKWTIYRCWFLIKPPCIGNFPLPCLITGGWCSCVSVYMPGTTWNEGTRYKSHAVSWSS